MQTTLDPAKRLDIFFRLDRDGRKVFNFFDADGNAFDISAFTPEFMIKHVPESTSSIYEPGILQTNPNQWTVDFVKIDMAALTPPLKKKVYYWELMISDGSLEKTWFTGNATAQNGIFNGVDTEENSFTIILDGAPISVVISDSILTPSQITDLLAQIAASTLGVTQNQTIVAGVNEINLVAGTRINLNLTVASGVPNASVITLNMNLASHAIGTQIFIKFGQVDSPALIGWQIEWGGSARMRDMTLYVYKPILHCIVDGVFGITPVTNGRGRRVALASIGTSATAFIDSDLVIKRIGFTFWTRFKFFAKFTCASGAAGIKIRLATNTGFEMGPGFLAWKAKISSGALTEVVSSGHILLADVVTTTTSNPDANFIEVEGTIRGDGVFQDVKLQFAAQTNGQAVQIERWHSYVDFESMFDQV